MMKCALIVDGKSEPSCPVGKTLPRIVLKFACLEPALIDAKSGEHGQLPGMTNVE